jgi:hypothetical protein
LIFVLAGSSAYSVEPNCVEWFQKSKISQSDKECEEKCSMQKVDLDTFYCTDRCDELCRALGKPSCADAKKKWLKTLSAGRPPVWLEKAERSKDWTSPERERVAAALSSLPSKLTEKTAFKIYRMQKSLLGPANPAAGLGAISIVLYDDAFAKSAPPLARILAHELAHFFYEKMSGGDQDLYELVAQWKRLNKFSAPRPGRTSSEYVESDGENSPEEDFANNIEYEMFERAALMKKSKAIDVWIGSHFGDSLKLGVSCETK